MYLYLYFACICIFILDGGVVGYLAEIATRSPLASSHRITRDSDSTTPDYISCYFDILILIDKKSSWS